MRRSEVVARSESQLDGFQIQFLAPRIPHDRPCSDQDSEAAQQIAAVKKWTVRLSFDFPELGKISALISLAAETRLEMNFWCQRSGTVALIQSRLAKLQRKLKSRLKSQGVKDLTIAVHEGEVPTRSPLVASHLINEVV